LVYVKLSRQLLYACFFLADRPASPESYTLSLHDALPISPAAAPRAWDRNSPTAAPLPAARHKKCSAPSACAHRTPPLTSARSKTDRKSTRLNSSHVKISYAVFCLKKKSKY